jgi:NTP pyrophosphatase (non-canonical NTP hydrolase)
MMLANDYQAAASRTLIDEPDTTFTNEELAIMVAALDLGAAVGKVLEYVKKGICHRHGFKIRDFDDRLFDVSVAVTNLAQYNSIEPPSYQLSGNDQMLIWCALGLGGEAGEVMDVISNCPIDTDYTSVLVKELGDNDWYNAALCTLIGVPMSDVMQANIDKLKKRFPDGWGTDASKARVDVQ